MGGHAFPQPSTRLTTTQLNGLAAFCSSRLTTPALSDAASSGIFSSVVLNRHFSLKDDHGDLDLLCVWEGANVAHLCGVRSGVLGEVVDEGQVEDIMRREIEGKMAKEAVGRKIKGSLGGAVLDRGLVEERVGWSMGVWRMAKGVCDRLGATEWMVHWPVIHFAIPCRVLVGDIDTAVYEDNGEEPFYQLDIFPVHSNKLELTKFLISYSHLHHILSQLLLLLSPIIWLRTTDLCFRHSPYPNQTRIEFKLSESRDQIFRWLGLDAIGYDTQVFADREELWAWLVDVEENTILGQALMRFIDVVASENGSTSSARGSVADKLFRGSHVIEDFSDWLLSHTKWGALTRDKRATLSSSSTSSISRSASSVLGSSSTSPMTSLGSPDEVDGKIAISRLSSLLCPPNPVRLDNIAQVMLAHFGQNAQYAACLGEKQKEAKEIAEGKRWKSIMRDVRVEAHTRLMQANIRRREKEAEELAKLMLAWLTELDAM